MCLKCANHTTVNFVRDNKYDVELVKRCPSCFEEDDRPDVDKIYVNQECTLL